MKKEEKVFCPHCQVEMAGLYFMGYTCPMCQIFYSVDNSGKVLTPLAKVL